MVKFIIGFIVFMVFGITWVILADSIKWKKVVNMFVEYIVDKKDVRIEFSENVCVGRIKCICRDIYGEQQILEKEYPYKDDGKGTISRVAKDIYAKLPLNKYEILFDSFDGIIIKESLEYELSNNVPYSQRKSDATSFQERLRAIAPKEENNGRQKYIEDIVDKSYKSIVEHMEHTARNTIYKQGVKINKTIYFNDPCLLSVKNEGVKSGEGVFVPMTKQRRYWSVEVTPILMDVIEQLKKKCLNDKINSTTQIEVKFMKAHSSVDGARKSYYPLEKIKIVGDWDENRIMASVVFTASIEY